MASTQSQPSQTNVTDECTIWEGGVRSDCASITSPPPPGALPPSPPPPPPPSGTPQIVACSSISDRLPDKFPIYTLSPYALSKCPSGTGYYQYCVTSENQMTAVCTTTNYVTGTCNSNFPTTDGSAHYTCPSDPPSHLVNCLDPNNPAYVKLACM